MHLEVRTPERLVVDVAVEAVNAPLPDGWIGILSGHAPFQARVRPGVISYRLPEGGAQQVAVHGGFLSVQNDQVTILTGVAREGVDLETLDEAISHEEKQLEAMEEEARQRFDRIYQKMTHSFSRKRRQEP
ncbi:ATP synthase F1 subunit epsilon [Salinigranum marinum]|uniref:ATP synthase F1 subunit epsilon n=1 Tax=Salinigranum marinum TaxID=1515595 RepID=UPI002989BE31|nr:ATP synthase F1 subunit epsilon [Salinigranum marinum]